MGHWRVMNIIARYKLTGKAIANSSVKKKEP
jgi:hypothetical protein